MTLKFKPYSFLFVAIAMAIIWSCSSDSSSDDGTDNSVSNLIVTIDVLGTNASNPNGDGSGVVNVSATATNAVSYGFKFGSAAEQQNTSGNFQQIFTDEGSNTYIVTVKAYGSGGESISEVETFSVFVTEDTSVILPSSLVLSANIEGADTSNPYGDGTGVVNFNAQATDAVSYGYIIDGGNEVQSVDGTYQYTFNSVEGIDNHDITVIAYSSTNDSIDNSETIPVSYYVGDPPAWADEFFQDGAPNNENWTYDLGDGGWGNDEVQTYTNNSSNVKVEDGLLKIIAKANGTGYTSSRLKSQGLYQFTYGRVDIRAKLPSSAGTWPALWMLGSDYTTVGWPRCGEIDIMEQTGWDKNKTLGTLHWYNTASSGHASYGLDKTVSTSTTEFHVYSVEWNASSIKILVDDVQFFVMNSGSSSVSSSPFTSDFFLILNVAMGGSLGGDIPANFTEDSMEIDYVRVYQ